MSLKSLKKIRVIISILFFIAISVIFLDIYNLIPKESFQYITYLQFIPSFIEFISISAFLSTGFIIVFVLTLLFGRVYCSFLCPVGTLQDIIIFLKKKLFRKKNYNYEFKKPHNIIRYSILILTAGLFVFANLFAIILLDPFSNFGRLLSDLVRPILIFLNNSTSSLLTSLNIHIIHHLENHIASIGTLAIPIIFALLIILFSIKYGRLYCNTICPLGALLALISKISLFKIVIDNANCKLCGKCEKACKSNCLDYENKTLDWSRCISCYNCIDSCELDGFRFATSLNKKKILFDENKRKVITTSIPAFLGLSLLTGSKSSVGTKTQIDELRKTPHPGTPPGSIGVDRFMDNCTACHLCTSVCPTGVLRPSFLEYGISGMLQPYMDYNTNFCNYDCVECSKVCPTGAILEINKEKKHKIQIGQVVLDWEKCVVYTDHTDCGACAEVCPTQAVFMVPYNGIRKPETQVEICVGCGACQYACPVVPEKAIFVNPLAVHSIAEDAKSFRREVLEAKPFRSDEKVIDSTKIDTKIKDTTLKKKDTVKIKKKSSEELRDEFPF